MKPKNVKKRKFDECCDADDKYAINKKIKLFKEDDKLIYSIGTEIHFSDSITKESIETLIKKITKIINKNHEKYDGGDEKLNIMIVVDSLGGSVHAILKFVDFIKMSKQKYEYLEFTSIITGCVASAGTIMCIVCDHRYMTQNSKAMLHELSSGRSGVYTHLKSYTDHLTDLHDTLANIYIENTDKTKDEIEKILIKETWYNAQQYLNEGFVDKII